MSLIGWLKGSKVFHAAEHAAMELLPQLKSIAQWDGTMERGLLLAMKTAFGDAKAGRTMKYRAGVAITGVTLKYAGAVYSHRTGKVYFSPMAHTHFAEYDPVANTINEAFAAHGQAGATPLYFAGTCLLDDGRIFAVPFESMAAVVLDPTTGTVEAQTGGTLPGTTATQKFSGCTQAYTGEVIMAPYSGATIIGRYNPTTRTYTAGPSTGGAGTFECATAHPNGNVYFSPLSASRVAWFDPDDNTYHTSAMSALSGSLRFQGAVVVPSGKIVMIPFNYGQIGVYDPATDTWAESAAHGKGSNAWNGGHLLGDGRVLMIPRGADNFGIFDPESMTYSDGPTDVSWTAALAFCGGAMLPNGTCVAAPFNHTTVGLVDTWTIPNASPMIWHHPAFQHY